MGISDQSRDFLTLLVQNHGDRKAQHAHFPRHFGARITVERQVVDANLIKKSANTRELISTGRDCHNLKGIPTVFGL